MFVVGTAGHVDHGKSTLVYRLTGMDPDRLAEEKRRGMTIDLGFAWLALPSGREVSIVDVPGHERFVRNMLAGVGGIDVALLVVAADEGMMPQTREHLAIIDLLGIRHGVVVVTKIDMVEADWLELATDDIRQELAGTVLEGAPLLPVSAVSGAGLDALKATLDTVLATITPPTPSGYPRLPVDRVFTLSGHGTVVTGTLLDGALRVGDEVEVLPSGLRSRVRSLQTHRHKVEVAPPGSRVAANLVGLTVDQLHRGDVLCRPGALQPTMTVDVSLRLLAVAGQSLVAGDAVLFYSGAAEIPATVRILNGASIAPEQTGAAQLRLVEAAVLRRGDHFIVRRPSPPETIGGGVVLDPQARRVRRGGASVVLTSEMDAHALLEEVLRSRRLWAISDLAERLQLPPTATALAVQELQQEGFAIVAGEAVAANEGWQALAAAAHRTLAAYHAAQPLRAGMPREELRERLGIAPALWLPVTQRLIADGVLAQRGALLREPDFAPRLSPAQQQRAAGVLAALSAGGYSPPSLSDLLGTGADDADLLAYLVEQGQVVRLNEQLVYSGTTYQDMVRRVLTTLEGGPITVAQVRDLLDISRRYSLALLEHLDALRITRRSGDERTLLRRPEWLDKSSATP
ncbi:MAG: selenocysteine-specific translation elongation factor [Chloroflexota bacterium]